MNSDTLQYYQATASEPRSPQQITVIRMLLEKHYGLAAALAFAAAAISAAAAAPAPPKNGPERDLVAATLVLEAGGEGRAGMAAVWQTIWNRCHRRQWHSQPYKVVAQPLQFSSLNGRSHAASIAKAKRHPAWRVAYGLVGAPPTSTNANGADHFHATNMRRLPYWAKGQRPVARIGGHIFYKLSNR